MGINIQTIKDIKLYLNRELEGLYPQHEINAFINIILRTLFRSERLHNMIRPETRISRKQAGEIRSICKELITGKPVQYILGETSFYNLTIRITPETLIPRPETEELVNTIIKENRGFTGNVLDAGTGSGCIAIALAVNLPGSIVYGFDSSAEALLLAEENARLNNASVKFFQADMLDPDLTLFEKTDIIVSNPPYVTESEKYFMASNVLDYEPHRALFVPDSEPLKFYNAILFIADKILRPSGKIYFEINEAMGGKVARILDTSGYTTIETLKDLNSKERIVKATKCNKG